MRKLIIIAVLLALSIIACSESSSNNSTQSPIISTHNATLLTPSAIVKSTTTALPDNNTQSAITFTPNSEYARNRYFNYGKGVPNEWYALTTNDAHYVTTNGKVEWEAQSAAGLQQDYYLPVRSHGYVCRAAVILTTTANTLTLLVLSSDGTQIAQVGYHTNPVQSTYTLEFNLPLQTHIYWRIVTGSGAHTTTLDEVSLKCNVQS